MKGTSITLILLVLCMACTSCGGSGGGSSPTNIPPVLKNLGLDIEPFNSTTGMAGAFNFTEADAIDAAIFTVFGDLLNGTTLNPTFEYKPDATSNVISMTGGTVSAVEFDDEHNDYAVTVIPVDSKGWIISYDHVLDLDVSEGNSISAGDIIGTVGGWYEGIGRTEIQVIVEDTGLSYCPFLVFDESLKSEYEGKIIQLMNDWEEYLGDPNIFDEDLMIYPGCYNETLEG
ncbi:MAG: peptidoglycan DD-metalloendopeptidase family protein [Deltaproteobacteria bacterium]|nr:peptidoglycan DD-metalloendopeptidase family protein [Deltaproteobacteria bacterium]